MRKQSRPFNLTVDEQFPSLETHPLVRRARGSPVGRQIRWIRMRLGMTQKQLARRAGISQQHVALLEKDGSQAELRTLTKVAEALQCTLAVLISPRDKLSRMIRKQAEKVAGKRLSKVMGNMALEGQEPPAAMSRRLLKDEIETLSRKPSSQLWEE